MPPTFLTVPVKLLLASLVAGGSGLTEPPQATAMTSVTVHVSPRGSDVAAGTYDKPVLSLQRALAIAGTRPATISVAGGRYPALMDTTVRSAPTVLKATGPVRPVIDGLRLSGASGLTFQGFDLGPVKIQGARQVRISQSRIDGGVEITSIRSRSAASSSIALAYNEITGADRICVSVRGGSTDVELTGNHIHNCRVGVGGPPDEARSARITLKDNLIERMRADGIQFGDWQDVTIDRNVVRDVDDPEDLIHNDAIQTTGNVYRVRITNNRLQRSGGQLLLLKDNFGPVEDVTVANNLFVDAAAYAVQSSSTRLRFTGNTVWRSRYGGLLLRPSLRSGEAPKDAVVTDNILSGYSEMGGSVAGVRHNNGVATCGREVPPGLACGIDPGWAADESLFSLLPDRPLAGLSDPGVRVALLP